LGDRRDLLALPAIMDGCYATERTVPVVAEPSPLRQCATTGTVLSVALIAFYEYTFSWAHKIN
jgi:hypothetical protein